MRITLDTEKGIIIVPKTFKDALKKQNTMLKRMGVEKELTAKQFIEDAMNEAFSRPLVTQEQLKNWNPEFESQLIE